MFLRHPKGVVPTDRARQLAGPVQEVLDRARQVMAQAEEFDPATSTRRFLLGAPDGASAVLLPPLLARLGRDSPGIDLGVRNLVGRGFEQALTELDARRLDIALMPVAEIPARFATRVLYQEDFVLVVRPENPLARQMTLAGYAAAPHIVVSESGDPYGQVDKLLADRKLKRRVVLTVPNFLQALAIVSESDLVGAMPRHFVAKHAPRHKVVTLEPPIPLLSAPILAVVPQVAIRDGGLAWFLGVLESAARGAKTERRTKRRRS